MFLFYAFRDEIETTVKNNKEQHDIILWVAMDKEFSDHFTKYGVVKNLFPTYSINIYVLSDFEH